MAERMPGYRVGSFPAFDIIERGVLADGTPYRVCRRRADGWTRAFVGGGAGKRRSMSWLRSQARATDHFEQENA